MININQDNYQEVYYALQEELNEIYLEFEDWIMTEFIFYLFDNKFECKDESLFGLFEKVKQKVFKAEIREQKINELLNGK